MEGKRRPSGRLKDGYPGKSFRIPVIRIAVIPITTIQIEKKTSLSSFMFMDVLVRSFLKLARMRRE